MLHKICHTQVPNSRVAYQIVSYRERIIIHNIFMVSRVISGEEVLPLGPHHHFHPFHLVGQADPKTHGREKRRKLLVGYLE